jgi:nitrogenase molybdenum-cofactor synthesis protein NifE
MTTDLTEQDVIMGRGEKRLFHHQAGHRRYQPAAVFVYNTCVPALIGDDIEAVCKAGDRALGDPGGAGGRGGLLRHQEPGQPHRGRIHGQVCLRHPRARPVAARHRAGGVQGPRRLNLIGEYNIAGELWRVLPLFDELGLRVLCTLSGDARFREVQTMHRSEVNMMVCSKAMINVARKLQESFGTPWFEGSFYGVADVSQALRDFARIIGDPDLTARTEAADRPRGGGHPREARALAGAPPGTQGPALHRRGQVLVHRLGAARPRHDRGGHRHQEVHGGGQGAHPRAHGQDAVMIEDGNPRNLLDIVRRERCDILIAGGRNMYTALKARIPFLDINQEREFGYAGYTACWNWPGRSSAATRPCRSAR